MFNLYSSSSKPVQPEELTGSYELDWDKKETLHEPRLDVQTSKSGNQHSLTSGRQKTQRGKG